MESFPVTVCSAVPGDIEREAAAMDRGGRGDAAIGAGGRAAPGWGQRMPAA
jgi:hypothetical protein